MTSTPDPALLGARLQQALALHQQGRLADAKPLYEAVLQEAPAQPDALHLLGVLALQSGDADAAIARIRAAIAALPDNPDYHLNLAVALRSQGHLDDALACHDRALALNPGLATAWAGRAALHKALGRPEAAVADYGQALALNPAQAEAHYNLGNLLGDLGRLPEASAHYAQAATLKPDFDLALINHASAAFRLGQAGAALESADRALALRQDLPEPWIIRGHALLALARPQEALPAFAEALARRPGDARALLGEGKVLLQLGRNAEAASRLEAAAAAAPHDAEAPLLLGNACALLHREEAALAAYDRAIALAPADGAAWYVRAALLLRMSRLDDAVASFKEAFRLKPDNAQFEGALRNARQYLCDWTDFDGSLAHLRAAIRRGEMTLAPFAAQSIIGEADLQQQIAHIATRVMKWPAALPAPFAAAAPGRRIRLGYFSADFRDHPVAQLTAGIFEHHDRGDFEVFGFAFGPEDHGPLRERVRQGMDHWHDVSQQDDQAVARLARELGIDIAVDLGGFTHQTRPGIFSSRAAPVQVSYVGFLGTMGVAWMDYLVADPVLVPPAQRAYYDEQIVHLPWYQANDRSRPAATRLFTRAELGLPDTGVVFASFNNHYKITPDAFGHWMRILQAVPDSVLYLLVNPEAAQRHLRAAAEAHGVAGERLVFAGRVPREDYLARFRVADLFLDTWPCNAGTTASDALWMGVPVLTWAGSAMVSRMAASVLTAAGLPELVVADAEAYVATAVALARDPAQLATLRQRVLAQRERAPLFDIAAFTRHLEAAFRAMHERRQAGLPPQDITIAP